MPIEGAGPYRASLRLGRRRSLIVLLGIALALLGVISWTSYRELNRQEKFLHLLQAGTVKTELLYQFSSGLTCEGPGPGPNGEVQGPEKCQFVGPGGQPIGPVFTGDPFGGGPGGGLTQQQVTQMIPELITGQQAVIRDLKQRLGPRVMFSMRVSMLGTFIGIVFAVLLGATFFGAEFRWSIWRTLLTHEPRRGRVLLGKLLGLWTLVLVGFLGTLAVVSVLDVVMRVISGVHASGGPTIPHIVSQGGWALLSLELFATIAAALVIAARVTLAGLFTLLLIVGDGLLVAKYHWLRHYFPTQQIATLLPRPPLATGYVWHDLINGGFTCPPPPPPGVSPDQVIGECREIMLRPIPHWRASAVLAAWLIGFAMIAWGVLRARDVPS